MALEKLIPMTVDLGNGFTAEIYGEAGPTSPMAIKISNAGLPRPIMLEMNLAKMRQLVQLMNVSCNVVIALNTAS